MKAGNAYCEHRSHDGRTKCPHRASERDRFGNWACSTHLALLALMVKACRKRRRPRTR